MILVLPWAPELARLEAQLAEAQRLLPQQLVLAFRKTAALVSTKTAPQMPDPWPCGQHAHQRQIWEPWF
jgi:hypothetical protein